MPTALAAHRLHIPLVLHESDAMSGRATQLIARWATVICKGFPEAKNEIRQTLVRHSFSGRGKSEKSSSEHQYIFTGNPVRPELLHGSREKGLRLTNFSGTRPVLLVMGGSQGAQALNEIIRHRLDDLLAFCDVVHLTGRGKEGGDERPGYVSRAFAHADLAHLYAIADACLSRSGASSIAELSLLQIPTLLVPLRGVARDHQAANARVAMNMGGFRMAEQDTLDRTVVTQIKDLLSNMPVRDAMKASMARFAVPDAADHLAHILLDSIGGPGQGSLR